MKKTTIIDIIVFALILLFVYAGIIKLIDYENTIMQLDKNPYLKPYSGFLAFALPIVELATALILYFARYRTLGLYLSFFIMLAFTLYVASNVIVDKYRPCACGGILNTMTWEQHLVFNVVFTIAAFVGIRLQGKVSAAGNDGGKHAVQGTA